jgi:hypothetical protein
MFAPAQVSARIDETINVTDPERDGDRRRGDGLARGLPQAAVIKGAAVARHDGWPAHCLT